MSEFYYSPFASVRDSVLRVLMFMRSESCYDADLEDKLFQFLIVVRNIEKSSEK